MQKDFIHTFRASNLRVAGVRVFVKSFDYRFSGRFNVTKFTPERRTTRMTSQSDVRIAIQKIKFYFVIDLLFFFHWKYLWFCDKLHFVGCGEPIVNWLTFGLTTEISDKRNFSVGIACYILGGCGFENVYSGEIGDFGVFGSWLLGGNEHRFPIPNKVRRVEWGDTPPRILTSFPEEVSRRHVKVTLDLCVSRPNP